METLDESRTSSTTNITPSINLLVMWFFWLGKLFIVIDDEVERRLRLAVVLRGGRKGDLSSTIEEAVEEWLKKHSGEIKRAVRI